MSKFAIVLGLCFLGLGCGGEEEKPTTSNNGTTANNGTASNNGTTASNNGTTASNNGTTASNNGTTASNNGGTTSASKIGKRCTDADDCGGDLVCFTEFFGERAVCTKECGECPDDSECVGGIADFNSQPLGPRCVKSCEVPADCAVLGSECATHETLGEASYCF